MIELVQQNLGSLLLMVDFQEQAGNLAVAIGMLSLVRLPALSCHTLSFPALNIVSRTAVTFCTLFLLYFHKRTCIYIRTKAKHDTVCLP